MCVCVCVCAEGWVPSQFYRVVYVCVCGGGGGTFVVLQSNVCVCMEEWVPLEFYKVVCVEGGYPWSFTR